MDEKLNILTMPNNGTDSATAMAMMNNNPWINPYKTTSTSTTSNG